MPAKNKIIEVQGGEITILAGKELDYICITDIARYKNSEHTDDLIRNWLRNRHTIEILGIWERLNNPDFKPVEFDGFKKQAGLNSFTLTLKQWIENTGAIGIISKAGRYGGTYAHKDIAFEFASLISEAFKRYLIKEFQRLKDLETLKHAQSLIHNRDELGYCLMSDFLKIQLFLRDNHNKYDCYKDKSEKENKLANWFWCISNKLSILPILVHRIDWQRNLLKKNGIDQNSWMNFTSIDIEYFHILIRSIFDYLASVIRALSNSPTQMPGDSFRCSFEKLLNKVQKGKISPKKLGSDLIPLVTEVGWFKDLRNIRNSFIHLDGFTFSFYDPRTNRISFKICPDKKNISIPREIFINCDDGIIDFELYSAYYYAHLLEYIEKATGIFKSKLYLEDIDLVETMKCGEGYNLLRNWMGKLLKVLEKE